LYPNSESAAVSTRLASEFGAGKSSLIALFRSSTSSDAASGPFQAAIAQTLAPLKTDPRVTGLVGYADTGDRRFISTKGDAAYVLIELNMTDDQSVAAVDDLKAKLAPPAGTTVALTGYGPITKDSADQSEKDLQRAETVSLPIAALILVAVFASLIAAGMPLLVAGLSIPSTLALIYFVSQRAQMSVYVLNIATMLGLALAIDYSLFIVSRFREELRRGRTVEEAVERAVGTAGKAVAFSGLAVAIGLSGLCAVHCVASTILLAAMASLSHGKGFDATLGGTLVKDRVWFFASGERSEPLFASQYGDAKMIAQLGDRQSLATSFAASRQAGLTTGTTLAAPIPSSFLSLHYTGIVSSNMFVTASFSELRRSNAGN